MGNTMLPGSRLLGSRLLAFRLSKASDAVSDAVSHVRQAIREPTLALPR